MVAVGTLFLFSLGSSFETNKMDNFPFAEKWKEVEKFINSGKPQSALEVVELIYAAAKEETAKPHLLRSIIERHKLSMQVEEIEYAVLIQRMEVEIKETEDPEVLALLQSVTASMYGEYLTRNSYRIRERIAIGSLSEDVNLWSIKDLELRGSELMGASLDLSIIKDISLEEFNLNDGNKLEVNPLNLKPFLLQHGIYYYQNDITSMTQVKDMSVLTQSFGLLPIKEFVKSNLETDINQAARRDNVINLYQQLLSYYQKQPYIQSKIDINRLQYAEMKFTSTSQKITDLESDFYNALRVGMKKSSDPNAEALYGYTLAQNYHNLANQYQKTFDPGFAELGIKAKTLLAQLKPTDKTLKAVISEYNTTIDLATVQLSLNEVNAPAVTHPFKVTFKNVNQFDLALHKLTAKEYFESIQRNYEENYHKILQKKPQVSTWSESLDLRKDYLTHSTELLLPPLEVGHYVLFVDNVCSTQGKYKAEEQFVLFQVSKQDVVKWTSTEGNTLQIVDRVTGSPLSDVDLQIYSSGRRNRTPGDQLISEDQTDVDGKAVVKKLENQYGLTLFSTLGEDVLVTRYNHQRANNRNNYRTTPHAFLDRSIYRPGQMLHGKVLLIQHNQDGHPQVKPDTEITLRLRDPNNQEIQTSKVKTNKYGAATFSLTVPSDGLKGSYRLYFDHPDGSTSTQVKVEEYRRPTLESSLDPVKGTAVLGDSIQMSGSVNTLSGFSTQGAQVTYTITESEYYHWYRCGWSSYWYPPYSNTSFIVATGSTVTDKDGRFNVTFATQADDLKRYQSGKQYQVDVVITDQGGETLTQSKSVYVTKEHFRIEHTLPSIINLMEKGLKNLSISGINLDNQSIPVESTVTIQRMKSADTYYQSRKYKFDHIQYSETEYYSNPIHYEYPRLDSEEAIDNDFKTIETDLENIESVLFDLEPGDYQITMTGISKEGHKAEGTHRVLLYDEQRISPSLLLYTNQSNVTAEVGSELDLSVLIHPEVEQVYYQKISKTEILEEGWLSRDEFMKVKLPISQSDMGGFTYTVKTNLKEDRSQVSLQVNVPYVDTNIDLTLNLDSLLLPSTEYQLGATVMCDGKPISDANVTMVMYDAALDQLYPHSWKRTFYPTFYSQVYEQALSRSRASSRSIPDANRNRYSSIYLNLEIIPRSSWYGILRSYSNRFNNGMTKSAGRARNMDQMQFSKEESSAPAPAMMADGDVTTTSSEMNTVDDQIQETQREEIAPPQVRSDFGETVFFDTDGMTDKKGEYSLDFETNDAISKWKVLAFVHDTEMRYGFTEVLTQTNKPLQIIQTPTRTLSEGDAVQWPITIQNSSDAVSNGTASIKVISYLAQEDVTSLFVSGPTSYEMTIASGGSKTHMFTLSVPDNYKDRVEVITEYLSADGSDAESRNLPVFSTDHYLTSGDPIWVRPKETQSFTLNSPEDAKTESFSIELATNPFWMVARSFPQLANESDRVTTSLSDQLVVESIGQKILQEHPEIERVMQSGVLQSEGTPLNRNEDLKIQELNSTPWVRQAKAAETRVDDFAKYFNKNNSNQRLISLSDRLWKRQNSDGGWPWIAGGRSSLYTTQRLLTDIAQLAESNISDKGISNQQLIQKGLDYNDKEIQKINKKLLYKNGLPSLFINDLYLYSLLPDGFKRPSYHTEWLRILEEKWLELSLPYQAIAGKIFIKNGKNGAANTIKESLLERAITRKDGTIFWRTINEYYSYYNDYAVQSLVLGFLADAGVTGDVIDRGSQWLIANKRSNEWYDDKATASVVYYLYQQYGAEVSDGDQVTLLVNGKSQELNRSLTYSTLDLSEFSATDVVSIEVNNKDDYPIFGGVYRQFFQPIDKVTRHPAAMNLSIKKSLYVKSTNGSEVTYKAIEAESVRVGDELKVRLDIESFDRLSYVYVTDTRPAGTEPLDQLSGYNSSNGLYVYQSPNDKGQEFFIEVLPKGRHTLEYTIRVLHAGDFTSGVAEIQSFYVPEFSAYDSYGRVETLPLSTVSVD